MGGIRFENWKSSDSNKSCFTKSKLASGYFWVMTTMAFAIDKMVITSKVRLLLVERISLSLNTMLRKQEVHFSVFSKRWGKGYLKIGNPVILVT